MGDEKHDETTLYLDDEDRYSRLRLIAWWKQEKISAAKVLVVGAGALGNEVLKNFALLGVGKIFIIDFDDIEDSNLTRSVLYRASDNGSKKVHAAKRAIEDINPDIRVIALDGNVITDLGLGVFADMDVVVGCLDNREARLWINRSCWKVGTPWIDGAIQEISGVVKVFTPPDSACYECAMTERDYQLINLKYSCPLLKREDLLQGKVPTAPTISSIVGGMQAQEALKIIHEMPVDAGQIAVFNGVSNQFYKTRLPFREDCLSHETYPAWEDLDLGVEVTVDEFFRAVGGEGAVLHFERDLLVDLYCPACDLRREVLRPLHSVKFEEGHCAGCGEVCQTEIIHELSSESPFGGKSLKDMGIPPYEIVRVSSKDDTRFYRLAGDREAVLGAFER